jgi:WD40 repeat protein
MSGDLLGTLRYMSPEQALAKRIIVDHRTDIYSLGATLYELLTLEPPFNGSDRQEILRQIAFEDPKLPRRSNRAIPAELETIVLKAMEKNPSDRYGTAQELVDDLRRYLDDRPIQARRPTLRQRAAKWAKRHKGVAWMIVGLLAVLALGSTVSTLLIAHQRNLAVKRGRDADRQRIAAQKEREDAIEERDNADKARIQAEQAEQQAKRAEAKTEAINQFLVRNMLTFSPAGAFGYRENDTTVAQVLEEAGRNVGAAFAGQPELEASVRLTIGNTFFRMRMFKEAEEHLRRGLELRGNVLADSADPWGREYAETAFATKRLGLALQELGRKEEAKPFLLRGGEARRRVEIRRIPFKVDAWPMTLHPLAVVFSPDGRWLLASGDDNCLRLYDVATGMEIHRFVAHDWMHGLAFSPDGRHALSGGNDKIVRLWDVYTAKELRQFTGHTDRIHFVAFSPDGRHALTASNDKTLRLWDVQSGEEIRKFLGHTDVIYYAAFSPDGRRLLSVGKDETMRLWEVGTGAEIRCFPKTRKANAAAVFSPDGRQALSSHDDGLRLWDVETGEELRGIPDAAGFGVAVFTPDGRHAVISGDTRGKWCLWDLDTGKEVRSYYVEPPLRPKGIEVSPDGRLAVCGNWRGSISIWRMGDPPAFGQELAEAGRYYDQNRREFGPDAPETLQALDELAALHLDRGEPADAEPLFRQSLERKQRILGAEHPATLTAIKNLAHVLQAQNNLAEAVVFFRECLEIYRRVQGPEHPDVIVAMNELADALEDQGKRDEADDLSRQCLEGWRRLLNPDHMETRAALRKLVLRLQAHGKPIEPVLFGPALGSVYGEMGHWDKALAGYAKAFELELPKEQWLWFDYACLLVHQGDTDGYRKLCGRLLERLGQSQNEDDIINLAHIFVLAPQALPDVGSILELAERRMAMARSGGPLYSNRFWSAHVLGLAYYRAGRYEKAVACLSEFLNDHHGGEHDVANWLLMALTEQRLGHHENALGWLDKADRWIKGKTLNMGQQRNFSAPQGHPWPYWLIIQSLHREAEALMLGKTADQEPIP